MLTFRENALPIDAAKVRITYLGGYPILFEVRGLAFSIDYEGRLQVETKSMIEIVEVAESDLFSVEDVEILEGFFSRLGNAAMTPIRAMGGIGGATLGTLDKVAWAGRDSVGAIKNAVTAVGKTAGALGHTAWAASDALRGRWGDAKDQLGYAGKSIASAGRDATSSAARAIDAAGHVLTAPTYAANMAKTAWNMPKRFEDKPIDKSLAKQTAQAISTFSKNVTKKLNVSTLHHLTGLDNVLDKIEIPFVDKNSKPAKAIVSLVARWMPMDDPVTAPAPAPASGA